jgi:hypothetical protein
VTAGRFDLTGNSMMISSGEITGGNNECCVYVRNVVMHIPNGRAFWKVQQNYGSHLTFVYGDYTRQIEGLGKLMNFEVVNIS